MSLIEEALRRAQQAAPAAEASGTSTPAQTLELDPPPLFQESAATSAASGARSEVPLQPWAGLAVVVVATVVLTLWIVKPLSRSVPAATTAPAHPAEIAKPAVPVPTTSAAAATAAVASPATANPAPAGAVHGRKRIQPTLILNGTIEGSGEPLAIINGSIRRVGETVEGATLLEIKKDAARLQWHDQEIVIRTTR